MLEKGWLNCNRNVICISNLVIASFLIANVMLVSSLLVLNIYTPSTIVILKEVNKVVTVKEYLLMISIYIEYVYNF